MKTRSLLYFLICGMLLTSCKTTSKSVKYYERQEEKQAAAGQKEYEDKVEKHNKMQSKNTLKVNKKLEKESKRLNKPRKPKSKPC